jgi:hypothetical protein
MKLERKKLNKANQTVSEKPHYVDKQKFYEAMCEYKAAVEKAKLEGTEKPQVSKYIGNCL